MSGRPQTAIGTYGSIRVVRLPVRRHTAHTRYRVVDGVLREVKATSTSTSPSKAIAELKSKLVARPGYGRGGMLSLTSPFGDLAELWLADLALREISEGTNVEAGLVLLLPIDQDESARQIRRELRRLSGAAIAVLVTDTAGRPWRNGLVDLAIGAAGLKVLVDCRSQVDSYGNELSLTITAAVDEITAFAELIAGKTVQIPVVVVRGLDHLVTLDDGPGARALVRARRGHVPDGHQQGGRTRAVGHLSFRGCRERCQKRQ